jgi:hypothetical protein
MPVCKKSCCKIIRLVFVIVLSCITLISQAQNILHVAIAVSPMIMCMVC